MQATISRSPDARPPDQVSPVQDAANSKVAIAFFSSCNEAQLAVDHLNHGGLRLHQMAIITDRSVAPEQQSDRSGAGRATFQGVPAPNAVTP